MTSEQLATYLRRVRETDSPAGLERIRAEIDAQFPDDDEALRVVAMATLKRVRLLASS